MRSGPLRSLPRGFAAASDDAAPSPRVSVPCGAISIGCPRAPEFCLLRFVPPPGFRNLLTAFSSQCLVALFRATGTRWVLPSELFSFAGSRTASRRPLPSCRSLPVPRFRENATTGQSRLQGLALLESPWPAAYWLGLRPPGALLGFRPSRVTHSARRKRCFHFLPLLSLTERDRNHDGCGFRGLPAEQHGWSPQRLPTLLGFFHLVELADGLEARSPGLWFFLVPRSSVSGVR